MAFSRLPSPSILPLLRHNSVLASADPAIFKWTFRPASAILNRAGQRCRCPRSGRIYGGSSHGFAKAAGRSVSVACNGSSRSSGFKKKLYRYRPKGKPKIETKRTRRRTRAEPCDPVSLERGVRQRLADKISGNMVGLWLLIPEHLRLGTWDLLCGWSGQPGERSSTSASADRRPSRSNQSPPENRCR